MFTSVRASCAMIADPYKCVISPSQVHNTLVLPMPPSQAVTQRLVKKGMNLVRRSGYTPHFVHFLAQICGHRDRPVPNNQVGAMRARNGGQRRQQAVFLTTRRLGGHLDPLSSQAGGGILI
jgi:hypothetical protein